MKQERYIKPMIRVKEMRVALLETISGGNQSWDAKQGDFFESSYLEIEQGAEEIEKMFE